MMHLTLLVVTIGWSTLLGAAPTGGGFDDSGNATPKAEAGSRTASPEAVKLTQGTVTRVAGYSVGVFYVIERKMKIAVWCDGDDEDAGRDLTVEVGGTVEIGDRSFALIRTNAVANPPYAILAPRPLPPGSYQAYSRTLLDLSDESKGLIERHVKRNAESLSWNGR